jgi:hypothetical protein
MRHRHSSPSKRCLAPLSLDGASCSFHLLTSDFVLMQESATTTTWGCRGLAGGASVGASFCCGDRRRLLRGNAGGAASMQARCCHGTVALLPAWWHGAVMTRQTCCQHGGVTLPWLGGPAVSVVVWCCHGGTALLLVAARGATSWESDATSDGQRCY